MKLDKTQVAVFIESEPHLQQARELLEKYGERLDERTLYLTVDESFNFLKLNRTKSWTLGFKPLGLNKLCKLRTQITLSELEEILKEEL